MQVGDVGNNGTSDIDYAASIAEHTATPPSNATLFRGGVAWSSNLQHADFDQSYDPINGLTYQNTASRYTVVEGDTLETIAIQVWGDASFWYMIADANGLSASDTLIAGRDLIIPNKIHNSHNTSDVYRVYDPNEAIGDTSPTAPKPPKDQSGGCGVMGQILTVIVAVVVSYFFGPVIGDIAKQLTAMALGDQSQFNWKEVGVTAAAALLVGPGGGGNLLQTVVHAVAFNAVTQGLNLAVGLQKKFDWTGLAAAAVTAGVMHAVNPNINLGNATINEAANSLVSGMAGAFAGAATRTLIDGTDFGDNLMAVLPDVIGNTIGNAFCNAVSAGPASEAAKQQAKDQFDAAVGSNPYAIGSAPGASASYPQHVDTVTLTAEDAVGTTSDGLLIFNLKSRPTTMDGGVPMSSELLGLRDNFITTSASSVNVQIYKIDGAISWAFENPDTGLLSGLIPTGPDGRSPMSFPVTAIDGGVTFTAGQDPGMLAEIIDGFGSHVFGSLASMYTGVKDAINDPVGTAAALASLATPWGASAFGQHVAHDLWNWGQRTYGDFQTARGNGTLPRFFAGMAGNLAPTVLATALAPEIRGVGFAAQKVAIRTNFSAYEVLSEQPIVGLSRSTQRAAANQSFYAELKSNPELAQMFNEELGGNVTNHMEGGVGDNLLNPQGTVWHHPIDNASVLQLLLRSEHTNPLLQPTLHPEGIGGYATFYGH